MQVAMALKPPSVVGINNCFGVFIPDEISDDQWQKIMVGMRARGHDFPDIGTVKTKLLRIAGGMKYVSCAFFDWVSTLIWVFNLYPVRPSPEIPREKVEKALLKAVEEWGTTDNPYKGGFILQDGRFLDMSCGLLTRTMDHVHINVFLGLSKEHSLELWEDIGLIRWNSEGRGVSMMARPSPHQLRTVESLATHKPNLPFHADAYEYRFGFGGRKYPGGVSGVRLVHDIVTFYDTGCLPALRA
jgi:hypothetical protein